MLDEDFSSWKTTSKGGTLGHCILGGVVSISDGHRCDNKWCKDFTFSMSLGKQAIELRKDCTYIQKKGTIWMSSRNEIILIVMCINFPPFPSSEKVGTNDTWMESRYFLSLKLQCVKWKMDWITALNMTHTHKNIESEELVLEIAKWNRNKIQK